MLLGVRAATVWLLAFYISTLKPDAASGQRPSQFVLRIKFPCSVFPAACTEMCARYGLVPDETYCEDGNYVPPKKSADGKELYTGGVDWFMEVKCWCTDQQRSVYLDVAEKAVWELVA